MRSRFKNLLEVAKRINATKGDLIRYWVGNYDFVPDNAVVDSISILNEELEHYYDGLNYKGDYND